jgi:SLT domain-containing protein
MAGSGVERWRGLGLDVLSRVGAYRGLNLMGSIDRMLNQIRTESSGNPNARNDYDINAQRGDPSIGLLQVIGSTFRNALRGTPFEGLIGAGQYDPRASLTASTLYSLNRYGSLDRAWRGVAYDNGGALPPGFTMAYNGTGKTEHVFTHDQMVNGAGGFAQALEAAMAKALGGAPRGVHIENVNALSTGQVTAELDYALARLR